MKKIILLLIVIQFGACTSDDNLPTPQLNVSDLQLEVTNIKTTSIKTKITFSNIKVSNNPLLKKVLYKKESQSEWLDVSEGRILNLERGVAYVAKAVLILENLKEESKEVQFTTLGFDLKSITGRLVLHNRKYSLFSNTNNTDLELAPTLSGYIKIKNDSLPLVNIIVKDDFYLDFELPTNTQKFFENDTEYIPTKQFSIVLFSRDYSKKMTTEKWTIDNKTPHVSSVDNVILLDCPNSTTKMWYLRMFGYFWTTKDGFFDNTNDLYNNPKTTSITITNKNDSNITKTFSFDDMVESVLPLKVCYNVFDWPIVIAENNSYFHRNDRLRFILDPNYFIEGDYTITISFTDYTNQIYKSSNFDFKLVP